MDLIQPNDPQYFTETSSEFMTDTITDSNSMRGTTLLDLKITNNSDPLVRVCSYWKDCKVIVLDKKQKKKKTNGGFN